MTRFNPPLFEIASPGQEEHQTQITEVTLRDLFAAFAAAGMIASGEVHDVGIVAEQSYLAADALLQKRARLPV